VTVRPAPLTMRLPVAATDGAMVDRDGRWSRAARPSRPARWSHAHEGRMDLPVGRLDRIGRPIPASAPIAVTWHSWGDGSLPTGPHSVCESPGVVRAVSVPSNSRHIFTSL